MNTSTVPNTLTIDQLAALGSHSLDQIARNAVGTLTTFRVILGRCLVAAVRSEAYLQFGCSSAVHYACSVLGLSAWRARELMRLAKSLEELPHLRVAAENGRISWCKLREVLRVAKSEDDEFWLRVCQRPYDEVERLVARARAGRRLDAPTDHEAIAEVTELRLNLSADSMAIVERAIQGISQEAGRALPPAQALEWICAEYLTRCPLPVEQKAKEARTRARRDVQAEAENLDALECSARNIPAWSVATACSEEACPDNPEVQLVRPDRPHWANDRLQFNPESRLATAAQKAELLRRDGYRCKTPGCPNHLFLEAHHITFYSDDGKTVPENLVILCASCHKNIHEGRLRIEGRAPHNLRFLDRDGRDLAAQHTIWLAHWLDFFIGWGDSSHTERAQVGLFGRDEPAEGDCHIDLAIGAVK